MKIKIKKFILISLPLTDQELQFLDLNLLQNKKTKMQKLFLEEHIAKEDFLIKTKIKKLVLS